METENFKHLYNVLNNEIKRIEPMYDRQADYQTNSKSYYDYLSKLKKLFELLSNRIWEYDDELKKRFEEWDKLIEKFPENVEKLLIEWLNDGVLENIINKKILNNLLEKSTKSIHGKRIISLKEYPLLNDEEFDNYRIKRMINDSKDYDILDFSEESKIFLNNETIEINKPLTLIGFNTELVTNENFSIYTIKIENTKNVLIDGFLFNLNLKGRNSIWIKNCNNVTIDNCQFTGYTAEFSHYKTDSSIMLYDTDFININNCYFYNNGFQYETDLETLNRCITHQGNSKKCNINNCYFDHVNQCIVSDTGEINVDNCHFYYTRDNDFYLLGGDCNISNCFINDYHDESIVLGNMNNVNISNIVGKNIPNKFISLTNDCKNITLNNINVKNEEINSGQFIVYRNKDISIKSLTITNLLFENEKYEFNYPFIEIYNVKKLFINNMKLYVSISENQNISFINNCNGLINELCFEKKNGNGNGYFNFDNSEIELGNINLINGRISKNKNIQTNGKFIQTNTDIPYLSQGNRSIFYVDNTPQPQNKSGNRWNQGDIAINQLLNVNEGHNTDVIAWIFDGNEWKVLDYINSHRYGTYDPNDVQTPRFIGEVFVQTDTKEIWIAYGLEKTNWKNI